jgi:hypothetical protein
VQLTTPLKFFYGRFRALARSRPFPDLHCTGDKKSAIREYHPFYICNLQISFEWLTFLKTEGILRIQKVISKKDTNNGST